MQIEKLEYIVEVAKTGSISSAAQNLHVTISAVSQAIASLEFELGVTLFTRSRMGAVPTPEGTVMIQKTLELLGKYQELKETALGYTNTLTGELRLASIPGPMSLLVDTVIGFKKDHPQIELDISEKGSQEIIDDVRHNKVDMGFIILFENRPIDETGLVFERLLEGKMVAIVSKHSPLAREKTIGPKQLQSHPVVLYNDDYVKWFMHDFEAAYGPVDIRFTTNNTEAIRKAVKDHHAVSIGLNHSVTGSHYKDGLVMLDFNIPSHSPVYLGSVQAAGHALSPITKSFVNRLKLSLSDT